MILKNETTKELIYNENIATLLLASMSKNLNLVNSRKFPVTSSMFSSNIHKVIFRTLVKLNQAGARHADLVDIEEIVKLNDKWQEIYDQYNGSELVDLMLDIVPNDENYEAYYKTVNNHATLRALRDRGYNISQFYDEENDLDYSEDYEAKDIIAFYQLEISELNSKYNAKFTRDEIIAGTGTAELLQQFKTTPQFGASSMSSSLTQINNGLSRGNFVLRSAVSGSGKTTFSIGEVVNLGCTHIWSPTKKKWVENKHYVGEMVYIFVEMTTAEINPKVLGCVANVDYFKIITGKTTKEEDERLIQAGEYLTNSGIELISYPDYSIAGLRERINAAVLKHPNLYGVVFDYIEASGTMLAEYQSVVKNGGIHNAVANVGTALKEIAEEQNILVVSYTQCNASVSEAEFLDFMCIEASKSLRNKVDLGCCMIKAQEKPKQLKVAEEILVGMPKILYKPNLITYYYKARTGRFSGKLRCFSYMDYSTCRMVDLLVINERDEVQYKIDLKEYQNIDLAPEIDSITD